MACGSAAANPGITHRANQSNCSKYALHTCAKGRRLKPLSGWPLGVASHEHKVQKRTSPNDASHTPTSHPQKMATTHRHTMTTIDPEG